MNATLQLPIRAAHAIWAWPWGRFLAILGLFSFAGPVCGTTAVSFGASALKRQFFPAEMIPGVLVYGFVIGFPFAFLTGAIFAISALRFRLTKLRHAMGAALCAFILIVGGMLLARFIEQGSFPEPLDFEGLMSSFMIAAPSLVAAAICWRLTREWSE